MRSFEKTFYLTSPGLILLTTVTLGLLVWSGCGPKHKCLKWGETLNPQGRYTRVCVESVPIDENPVDWDFEVEPGPQSERKRYMQTSVCRKSIGCTLYGKCKGGAKECYAKSMADCMISACPRFGKCTFFKRFGSCRATNNADCGKSEKCREEGACRAKYGLCIK